MQGACYNQLAVALYTSAARQQSRKHCAICGSFSALYLLWLPIINNTYLVDVFLSDPAICNAGGPAVVRYMHAATGITLLLLLLLLLQYDFCGQQSVVEIPSPAPGASFSISVNSISLVHKQCCCVQWVWGVCRGCAVCAVCHAWSASKVFFCR